MQILDVTLNTLEGQGKRITPRLVYENALFFHLSVLLNTTSGKVLKEDGSPIKYYGITMAPSSCVSGDTEFMTESGWKRIDQYKINDKVLEINKDTFKGTFREPINYIKEDDNNLAYKYIQSGRNKVSMHLTDNHTVLRGIHYRDKKKPLKYKTNRMDEISNLNTIIIPHKFTIGDSVIDLDITDNEIRLMVALSADGTIIENRELKHKIRIKKYKKIERLKKLLLSLNIDFTKKQYKSDNINNEQYYTFFFNAKYNTKNFKDWAYKLSQRQLKILSDEIIYWDGRIDKDSAKNYFTTIKDNADFVQYAFQSSYDGSVSISISDRRGRIREINNKKYITKSIDYVVRSRTTKTIRAYKSQLIMEKLPNNTKYCFTTQDGFFLARKDNFIFITGNCGKDFSFDIIKNLFPIKDESYASFMMQHLSRNLEGMGFEEDETEKIKSYLPMNKFISSEGTSEGVMSSAYAQSLAHFGSLNVISSELGDNIRSSETLALKLKELYDGEVLAKNIKSENTPNIKNITTNAMLFGSQVGFDKDSKKILIRALKSGLFRRSFIVNIDSSFDIIEQTEQLDMTDIKQYFNQLTQQYIEDTDNCEKDYIFTQTLDYINRVKEINSELIKEANRNKVDDFKQIDSSGITIIENLAHILAFFDMRKEVNDNDLNLAYEFFKETRATIEPIIQPDRLHIRLFDIVRLSNNKMSFHDASKYISDIPDAKTKRDEILELFRDYAYYKGYVPEITGNKIKYFLLKEPEMNTLSSIIVSLDVHDYEKYNIESFASVSFIETSLDFFDNEKNNHSVEKLVTSSKVKSFSLSRFEESPTSNKKSLSGTAGHRKADCYISGANIIAFDIDDGMEIKEAISLLENYTYLIYTTRSHQKEKNGEMQGDRFRILIPTSNTFHVDTEQYKGLYNNIAEFLNIRIYDKQTLNVSRLWFTNTEAEIFTNEAELLDISALIPSTEKAELVLPNLALLQNNSDDNEYERRKLGMIKYMLTQTSSGNRSANLYKYACFIRDLGGNAKAETEALNAMLFDPLPEREMNSMLVNRF